MTIDWNVSRPTSPMWISISYYNILNSLTWLWIHGRSDTLFFSPKAKVKSLWVLVVLVMVQRWGVMSPTGFNCSFSTDMVSLTTTCIFWLEPYSVIEDISYPSQKHFLVMVMLGVKGAVKCYPLWSTYIRVAHVVVVNYTTPLGRYWYPDSTLFSQWW